jgi:protein TonB
MTRLIILLSLITSLIVSACAQEKSNDDTIVYAIEPHPSFPGGIDSLRNFIKRNLKYPFRTIDYEGNVFVEFIVNEGGSISDLKVIKGLCAKCDQSAMELLLSMPKWNPVIIQGKPIKSKMIVPIRFDFITD